MTDTATRMESIADASTIHALQRIKAAREQLVAAKRTRTPELIEHARRDVQVAVDAARELDVQWGPIGSALGIARGNAYQRYRKRPSLGGGYQDVGGPVAAYRRPSF